MADLAETKLHHPSEGDAERGAEAARLIWEDGPEVEALIDPRTPAFARAVIDGLSHALHGSPGVIKKMMKNAQHAAADLNVSRFQGLVEVIQNGDDLSATEVRFALREHGGSQQLLVVHNGFPVTCQHVLGMSLPYLTTKTNRIDQRGRFGIGLKTLDRIAEAIAVHSAPYHFSGNQLSLAGRDPEPALDGFYDSTKDTLLVLDLKADFDELAFKEWFDSWEDDGLLFLGSVGRFRWCTIDGATIAEKTLKFETWKDPGFVSIHDGVLKISQRRVRSATRAWTVWKATVSVPVHLHPAHKARSDTTNLSIALPDRAANGTLYIGFKTLVPVGLTFSLDGQFDPSTAREGAIENPWNNWLIDCCADLVTDVATGLLASDPLLAWALIPLEHERVGKDEDRWLRGRFDGAFCRVRSKLGERAVTRIGPDLVPLTAIAYEDRVLAGLLEPSDIIALAPQSDALPESIRDVAGRWRNVLDALAVSTVIGTTELLSGFDGGLFAAKDPLWWVEAAGRLTEFHTQNELFGRPFWLSDDGRALACRQPGETDRPLVLGERPSAFAARWHLLDQLHGAYGNNRAGDAAIDWLSKHAAFTRRVDPQTEMSAFAERFAEDPLAIDDADLRALRDRFDELSDRNAEPLGRKIGAVLLVDGYVYKAGKPLKLKVSPITAYLPRTIDSDHPDWPVATGTLAGIQWIAARYDDVLKTAATRARRRRDDGTISRGPRRFLMLLGTEVSPRLKQTGTIAWGSPTRVRHLQAAGAERVAYDYVSPDLNCVLKDLQRAFKKDAKLRSPALLRALSRNWDRCYQHYQTVPSEHVARVYTYPRGAVTAAWLNELRETEWVTVGRGERVEPAAAVIKTIETQTLYSTFAVGLDEGDVCDAIVTALHLITDVRVADLVNYIAQVRDGRHRADEAQLHQIYQTIAKRCPSTAVWNTRVGGLTVQELRGRFAEGGGLIQVGAGQWRRPDQVRRGKDIFHDRQRFVPGGPVLDDLWVVLGVRQSSLDGCLAFCKALAAQNYTVNASAALIDVYRYMEPLLATAERKHRTRLKSLPIACDGHWAVERPIYFVEDDELRSALATALPRCRFWSPPYNIRDLPTLVSMIDVTIANPAVRVTGGRVHAMECGDGHRERFGRAVDHLSDELARNDAATRERISIGWERLKTLPLFVYADAVPVQVKDPLFSARTIPVSLNAVMVREPIELHVSENGLGDREYGGRAVASFFPADVRRKIGGEWALAWQKSPEQAPDSIRLASDKEHREAMEQQAAKISGVPKAKIKVSAPASRKSVGPLRTLKESVGAIAEAVVVQGSPPEPVTTAGARSLASTPPAPCPPDQTEPSSAPVTYTSADLEQRAWELLEPVLNTSQDEQLVDFRRRHEIGADGVINWKTFVEMKSTGRGPQSSIELRNSEYERAKERGMDFILALVSGLETGQKDEIRLIFDPVNRLSVRPVNGVRLVGLLEAPCILVRFEDAGRAETPVTAMDQ
jgi:hypothetical protein